jgi:aspartate kinase
VRSGTATPLTDSLIPLTSRAGSPPDTSGTSADGSVASFSKTVDLIRSEHLAAARDCVKGKDLLAELEAEITGDCENLRAFLYATQVCRPK